MTPSRRIVAGDNLVWYDGNRLRLLDAVGPDVISFFDDFLGVAASDALVGWTTTLVEAGGGESTVTIVDALGGELLLTTDANEDDGINLQKIGENFTAAATTSLLYYGIRLKASEATNQDWLTGLCITDTTLLGGMTDGIYFEKLDGGTGISFVTEKNSTETQTDALATFAADTYVVLEFAYEAASAKVYAFINGSLVATHSANICDDELLTPSIQTLAGSADIRTLTVDWIRAIQIGR